MAQAVLMMSDAARGEAPHRCVGALVAGATIGNSASKMERFFVQGGDSIAVRAMVNITAGSNVTLDIYPMLSDATHDDTVGTRAVDGIPSSETLTDDTEHLLEYTLKGERYVDVEIACDGSAACTITRVDVYVRP